MISFLKILTIYVLLQLSMETTSANDNTVYNITINDTRTTLIQLGYFGNISDLANQEFTWNVYNGIGQYNLMLSYFMVFLMPNSVDDFLEILDENNNTVLNVNGNNQSYFNQLNNTYAYITPKQFTVHLKFSNKTDPSYKGSSTYGVVWGKVQLVQDTGCVAPAQLDANINYFWDTSEDYSIKGAFALNPLGLAFLGGIGVYPGPNSSFTTGSFYDSMSCKWQLKMHPEDYDFTQVKITPVNQLSSDDYLLVETNTGNQILSSDHNYTNTYKSFYSNESLFNITFHASKWNTSANGLNMTIAGKNFWTLDQYWNLFFSLAPMAKTRNITNNTKAILASEYYPLWTNMLLNETYVVQANKTVIFNLDVIYLYVSDNSSIKIFGDGSLKKNYSNVEAINGSLCIEASELKVVYQTYPVKDLPLKAGFMMNYTADFDSNTKCPVPSSSCEKLSTNLASITIFSCIAIFFKL